MGDMGTVGQAARATSLLIINPNTNVRVTDNIRAAVQRIIGPATRALVLNPSAGPFAIENEQHREAAEPHVVDLVRGSHATRHDAYVLSAFDDIGLSRARALTRAPVVGAVEAGIAAARTMARRFAVVTTVEAALPGIREQLRRHGAADMASVRAAGIGVTEAADRGYAARQCLLRSIYLAVHEDGAEAILLGSGGLTGWTDLLQDETDVPIIDGVLAAVKMAEAFANLCPLGQEDEITAT
ncbi:Hydantoin racemase [Hyphomicrobiales bacterium]|nr:Hydantoin racemase [Hyphomicrobiales bacterium]CAH1693866.1 Hydantoin racemase [Hyphomicrobiales bacterium]